MATSAEAPWATLHPSLIDAIAASLKRIHLWRQVRPSLRSLSRHWCRCISNNVKVLRPHSWRQLKPEDSKSFAKFPRVTTVDISQFLRREVTEAESQGILERLASMESLSRLEVEYSEPVIPFFSQTGLENLCSVTSLRFMGLPPTPVPASVFLQLAQLPLQEFISDGDIPNLEGLLETVPTLKKLQLDLRDGFQFSQTLISKLQSLESISFNSRVTHVSQLQHLPCLKHVGVRMPPEVAATTAQLTQLESLWLRVSPGYGGVMFRDCLSSLSRLTSLEVSTSSYGHFNCDFNCLLPQLQQLRLTCCIVSGPKLQSYFPRLSVLRMLDCRILEAELFWPWMGNLKVFDVDCVRGEDGNRLCLPWELVSLTKLSVLRTHIYTVTDLGVMNAVARMTRLEKLELNIPTTNKPLRQEFFKKVNNLFQLKSLRELLVGPLLRKNELDMALETGGLTQLDVLGLRLSSRLCGVRTAEELRSSHEGLRTIQGKAPWLRVALTIAEVFKICRRWDFQEASDE